MDDSFHLRLAEAMERKRATLAQIGDIFGITPQSVHDWVKGNTKPRTARLRGIAEFLEVDESWLAWGEKDEPKNKKRIEEKERDAFQVAGKKSPQTVPLIGLKELDGLYGFDEIAETLQDLITNFREGDLDVYVNFGASAVGFAVLVEDNSMEPEIRFADAVIVNPEIEPDPGSIVIAHLIEHKTSVIRQFSFDGPDHILLSAINPQFRSYRFLIDEFQDKARILGVVTEFIRPRGPRAPDMSRK
jgi:SOS-response transcriptional repressor LexA